MSVQVQLRRDTLANVLANHGALGEVYISTDSKELFIQDGATNGGFKASGVRALFGSLAQPALAESTGASGETLTTGVTTYTTTLQLPAGYKFIMGAGWLVKTTITGITTVDLRFYSWPFLVFPGLSFSFFCLSRDFQTGWL